MGAKWKLSKRDIKRMGLVNIHDPKLCEGRGCPIHHWSKHSMRHLPLHWRYDRHIFERGPCDHGMSHPDPDAARYLDSIGKSVENVHGCCGMCCSSSPQDGASHEDDDG